MIHKYQKPAGAGFIHLLLLITQHKPNIWEAHLPTYWKMSFPDNGNKKNRAMRDIFYATILEPPPMGGSTRLENRFLLLDVLASYADDSFLLLSFVDDLGQALFQCVSNFQKFE